MSAYFAMNREISSFILPSLSCFFGYSHRTIVIKEEVDLMTVKERILALRLLEKQNHNPAYTKKIGVHVDLLKGGTRKQEEKNV